MLFVRQGGTMVALILQCLAQRKLFLFRTLPQPSAEPRLCQIQGLPLLPCNFPGSGPCFVPSLLCSWFLNASPVAGSI